MLEKRDFLRVVELTPLVAIDLVICSPQRQILMGKRVNRPAQNFWFVPGGRIMKEERLEHAFRRISSVELGVACNIEDARLLNGFTHLYDDNFAGVPDISTHYVVLAYRLDLELDLTRLPAQQHQGYRWIDEDEGKATGDIHANSQAYFAYLR